MNPLVCHVDSVPDARFVFPTCQHVYIAAVVEVCPDLYVIRCRCGHAWRRFGEASEFVKVKL